MTESIEGIPGIEEADSSRIAQVVFGSATRVDSIVEIQQTLEGGISRIIGCNWNLSYIVSLSGHDGRYVFRFNRQRYGRDDKAIVQKTQHNAQISAHTDVPTTTIHHMDVSRDLVLTGFIVMDYMTGEERRYLTHPEYCGTTSAEKEEIFHQVGVATAKISGRPPEACIAARPLR